MDFADKLLTYKDKRTELLSILEAAHRQVGLKYAYMDHGNFLDDICPFTVFGAFNKGLTMGNRIALMKAIADRMNIHANIPSKFDGVPVLNPQSAWFFAYKEDRHPKDIPNLWNMFESAINYADISTENNRITFIKIYDTVTKQAYVKWNITMGLYWIRPYFYLNLDTKNRQFFLLIEHLLDDERKYCRLLLCFFLTN